MAEGKSSKRKGNGPPGVPGETPTGAATGAAKPDMGLKPDDGSRSVAIDETASYGVVRRDRQERGSGIDEDAGSRTLNRRALVTMLIVLGLALVPILRMFLVPVIMAATLAALFFPLYGFVLKRFRNRRVLSALTCCFVLLVCLLTPTYVLVHLVTRQTMQLYSTALPKVREAIREGDEGVLGDLKKSRVVRVLRINQVDWQAALQEGAKTLGRVGTYVVNRTSSGLFGLVGNVVVILFTMFYFFVDGEGIVGRMRYLSPLRADYEDMILSRFLLISRATIKGTLLIGLTQGTLGGVTLLICGVKTWLLWGFVMVILSIVPVAGAWLVMVPAAVVQFALGNVWQGVVILLAHVVVISNIDNLMRPRLVGRDARMHDLMVFFSTLGGIAVFGVLGFVVGPVIAALFVTVLDIYAMEYRTELTSPYTQPGE